MDRIAQTKSKMRLLIVAMLLTLTTCCTVLMVGCGSSDEKAGTAQAADAVQVKDVYLSIESPRLFKDAGGILVKQVLVDENGKEYPLLKTFDDRQQAMDAVKRGAPGSLVALQVRCILPFSELTWTLYRDAAQEYWGSEGDDEAMLLRQFFDIYENDDENAQIIDRAKAEGISAVKNELPDVD